MTFEQLRNKIAKAISQTGLPGTIWLSDIFRSRRAKEALKEHVSVIVENMIRKQNIAEGFAARHSHLAPWITGEKADLLPFGKVMAFDVTVLIIEFSEDEEDAVQTFDYLTASDAAWVAAANFFARFPAWSHNAGFFNLETGEPAPHLDESWNATIHQRFVKDLAHAIASATTDLGSYDDIYRKLTSH